MKTMWCGNARQQVGDDLRLNSDWKTDNMSSYANTRKSCVFQPMIETTDRKSSTANTRILQNLRTSNHILVFLGGIP